MASDCLTGVLITTGQSADKVAESQISLDHGTAAPRM